MACVRFMTPTSLLGPILSVYPVEPSLKNMSPLYCKSVALTSYHILVASIVIASFPGSSILFVSATAAVVKTSNSNSISNLTSEVEAEAETPRISKQIDRTDALLGGFNTADATELPLHEPTGEKTRKTYDFTRIYSVGLSCHDIQATQGATKSGVYLIHPPNIAQGPWKVYCDLQTEGGGWMVFQVRDDVLPKENFMRSWEDYKVGFGDFDREFWLGNILIWALTNVNNATRYELAIDMEDWSDNRRFARYRSFRLGSERDAFRLYHQNLYYGNAGDSLYSHNSMPFSTFDVDNDNRDGNFEESSCARLYKGGWWYGNCHDCNLNGWNLGGIHRSFADGINWYTWTGYNYSLRKTVMKMRPQIDGPIDIGYGNYLLTAPVERNKRQFWKADSEIPVEMEKIDVSDLLSLANTLTNPLAPAKKKKDKTEL